MSIEDVLARYKTTDSCPLELYYPMEFLQDQNFCLTLNKDITSCGNGWEVIDNINSASGAYIPKEKGVYLFIWKPDSKLLAENKDIEFRYVVYVGSSSAGDSSLYSRFSSNYKNLINSDLSVHWTQNSPNDRDSRLRKVLNLNKLEYWYVTMENSTEQQIQDIEKRLIRLFNPPGNKSFVSPIRAKVLTTKTAPAFEPAF